MGYGAGAQVILPVTANPVSSSKINSADVELAALNGPREMALTYLGFNYEGFSYNKSNLRWESAGGVTDSIIFPLSLYAGQTLTQIHFTIEIVTNGLIGDLHLMRRTRTPVAGNMVAMDTVATIDDDIWNGLTDGDATEMSYTGLSYTIAANFSYFLWLEARPSVVCYVHEAMIKAQNGS